MKPDDRQASALYAALEARDEAEPVSGRSRSDSVAPHGYVRALKALEDTKQLIRIARRGKRRGSRELDLLDILVEPLDKALADARARLLEALR